LGDDLVLARNRPLVRQGESVGLAFGADVVEARIPCTGALCLVGIDRVEVRDDCFDRGSQAVEVEPVEARHAERIGDPVVAFAQPVDELDHLGVAPHPGREAPEISQRLPSGAIVREPHHVAVDPVRVRPVGLHGDDVEAVVFDQVLGDARPRVVEFRRAVRRLAEQHHAAVGKALGK